jgi:hypothetical protein
MPARHVTSVVATRIVVLLLLALWTGALVVADRALALSPRDVWPLHERLLLAGSNLVIAYAPFAGVFGPPLAAAFGALRHRRGIPVATERRLLIAWIVTVAAAMAYEAWLPAPAHASRSAGLLALMLSPPLALVGFVACTYVAAHLQARLPVPHARRRAWIVAIATLLLAAVPIGGLWIVPPAFVWFSSRPLHPRAR